MEVSLITKGGFIAGILSFLQFKNRELNIVSIVRLKNKLRLISIFDAILKMMITE